MGKEVKFPIVIQIRLDCEGNVFVQRAGSPDVRPEMLNPEVVTCDSLCPCGGIAGSYVNRNAIAGFPCHVGIERNAIGKYEAC